MKSDLREAEHLNILSRLVIRANCGKKQVSMRMDTGELQQNLDYVSALSSGEAANFLALADAHHVSVRALTVLQNVATLEDAGSIVDWCESCLAMEHCRIERALTSLQQICGTLESEGCQVAVIKSLTHWPDLGSDLDLYTTGDPQNVVHVMRKVFAARLAPRSWGDRLANKWNFEVPGLAELVEIHVQYLGQTGEFGELARRVITRRIPKIVGGREFLVPAAEESIVLATLQRMYRHFYFRLCDMVDICSMVETESVDFAELMSATKGAGIWPGVAAFLCLVQQYIQSYGGVLPLPDAVLASGHSESGVRFKNGFLRVARTRAAGLYGMQLLHAGMRHDLRALLRLPLLPPLAVSAMVAYRLTGNDKGIW